MLVNSHMVSQFQRCKRPHLISKTHNITKWRPQSLLSACLRHAIFNLSNGKPLEEVTALAVNNFLATAKNPGLDVTGINTYTLAMDYCAVIRNVLEYLSRITLLMLKELKPVSLSRNVQWQFLSFMDESGVLHRWEFVDYLDKDVLSELHSWEVFGDIAAMDTPMVLHLVAIGKRSGSHQYSPWCKIYSHPKLANIYKFQKVSGHNLEGEWKPIWFSENSSNTSKQWVDLMMKENVIPSVIRHVQVREVSDTHKATFLHDVLFEAESMMQVADMEPRELPMSRYACDKPYTCPHQAFCYGVMPLDDVGIYSRKKEGVLV